MIQHLPAVLIIVVQLAVWAFYAMFVAAGVVLATLLTIWKIDLEEKSND